jgi:membrane-associated protease RseP (regulator of RpoE activity)
MSQTIEHEPAPEAPAGPAATPGGSGNLAALLGGVAGLVVLSLVLGFWKPLAVIASLFVMIMCHELGHYVMAKRGGMKCTEFFVGMGPRVWSVQRGEMEWGVKALPIGGYVKIIGMNNLDEVPPADEPRAYRQKGFLARMGVAVAGTATHLILAFGLLLVLNTFTGNPTHFEVVPVVSSVSRLSEGMSPAEKAGLRAGDRITALDGTAVTTWDEVKGYVGKRPGQPIAVDLLRKGAPVSVSIVPADAADITPLDEHGKPLERKVPVEHGVTGYIGIAATRVDPTVNPLQAVGRSFTDLGSTMKDTVKSLARLVTFKGISSYKDQLAGSPAAQKDPQGTRFLSPVGLYQVADRQAENGIASVLVLLVLINVFVGLFNMIPLLPFDGGHVSVAIYEEIRGRLQGGRRYIADVAKLLPVAYLTVAALLFIGISSLYLDIRHPLDLQ